MAAVPGVREQTLRFPPLQEVLLTAGAGGAPASHPCGTEAGGPPSLDAMDMPYGTFATPRNTTAAQCQH